MSEARMENDSGSDAASLSDREAHVFESLGELESGARVQRLADI